MKKGDLLASKSYGQLIILDASNLRRVELMFIKTGFVTCGTKDNIIHGRIKDKLTPTIYGVGFIGDGLHRSGDHAYSIWHSMIARCYGNDTSKNECYIGCSVSKEWHNYQNFAEWYNYHNVEAGFEIDKDIKFKGNKVYSPDNCLIVSRSENNKARVMNPSKNKHGFVGVLETKYKDTVYYGARVTVDGKRKRIGSFRTALEASEARDKYIDELAR